MKLTIFNIDKRQYALDISQICEVIRFTEITPICDVADFVEGIIKLRNDIIPIINMRKKFKSQFCQPTESNRIIIVKTNKNMVGIIVDSIEEVVTLDQEKISVPDTLLKESEYLIGVGIKENNLILILDINKLVPDNETIKA